MVMRYFLSLYLNYPSAFCYNVHKLYNLEIWSFPKINTPHLTWPTLNWNSRHCLVRSVALIGPFNIFNFEEYFCINYTANLKLGICWIIFRWLCIDIFFTSVFNLVRSHTTPNCLCIINTISFQFLSHLFGNIIKNNNHHRLKLAHLFSNIVTKAYFDFRSK